MHRWLRVSAALFWFVWACVIVPGHTRGAIRLDAKGRCCHTPTRDSSKSVPASKNCAICFVAAKVGKQTVAPAAVLQLPFAYRAAVTQPTQAASLGLILAFDTRGPPDSSTANT
jgi:hypothetical protein